MAPELKRSLEGQQSGRDNLKEEGLYTMCLAWNGGRKMEWEATVWGLEVSGRWITSRPSAAVVAVLALSVVIEVVARIVLCLRNNGMNQCCKYSSL